MGNPIPKPKKTLKLKVKVQEPDLSTTQAPVTASTENDDNLVLEVLSKLSP